MFFFVIILISFTLSLKYCYLVFNELCFSLFHAKVLYLQHKFFHTPWFYMFFSSFLCCKICLYSLKAIIKIFNNLKSSAVFLFCEIHSPETMVCCKSILVDGYLIFIFFSNCSFSSCSYFLHIFPLLLNIFHCKKNCPCPSLFWFIFYRV